MRTLFIVLWLAAVAAAQYPAGANTLRWNGLNPVGSFCWGFSCTPAATNLVPGETGSLFIRSEYNEPYAIGLSLTATRCLAIPGIYNRLVIDDPILIILTGFCATGSPILSCPGGTDSIPITIPVSWPSNLTFSLQGVTGSSSSLGASLSFTQAINFTVL